MGHVIILEGPDGSGKSTLAKLLVEQYHYGYIHNGLYANEDSEQLLNIYTNQILGALDMAKDIVIDRSFLSEHVYGPVMRACDRLEMGRTLLTRLTRARDVTEVICLPSWVTVRENWTEKRKDRWDPITGKGDYVDGVMKLRSIYDRYQAQLYAGSHYKKYDYVEDSIAVTSALSWILPRRYDVLPDGVIGSPDASVLIVGERVNPNKARLWELPFYDIYASSGFLHGTLRQLDIPEQEFAFTNAMTSLGARDLNEVTKHLPRFYTAIALGNVAAQVCAEQGIRHFKVPHPAYYLRFMGKGTKYNQLIKEALCA